MAIQLTTPRIGLVLGAGGVLGGAWTAGVLAAIARETGWDPSSASHVVGTSAGSVFSALTAAGVPPERLLPVSDGALGSVDDLGEWLLAELAAEDSYRPQAVPRPLPGSFQLALRGLRERNGLSVLRTLSGLAPQGPVSTEPIQRTVLKALGGRRGWVDHPNCWIVACDYQTGERVVFGREGSPRVDLPRAVAASCAIPGFFQPVRVNHRCYVDGGLHSMSNADLLAEEQLDLVVVVSPLSSRVRQRSWHPLDRVAGTMRRLAAWQLDLEVTGLLDAGTHVVVLEPTADDMVAIGSNVMDARRSLEVADTALRTTGQQLRRPDVQELLSLLPRRAGAARRAARFTDLLRRAGLAAAAAV